MTDLPEKISNWRLAAFASMAFPSVGMTLPLAIFLPPYYTKTLGLGLAEVGLVFMLVRIFDIVTDPLMGIVGDRFVSRWAMFLAYVSIRGFKLDRAAQQKLQHKLLQRDARLDH